IRLMENDLVAENENLRAETDVLQAENAQLQIELLELYTLNVTQFFEGSLDAVTDGVLYGWVWDKFHPERSLHVDLYDCATPLATVAADLFRHDLLEAGKGTGQYGFAYPLPAGLEERAPAFRGVVAGTSFELFMPELGRPDNIPLPPEDLFRLTGHPDGPTFDEAA